MNISRRLDDVLLMALCFCTVVHTGHSSLHLQEILEGEDVEDRDCVTAKNACLSRRTCRDALVLTMTQCQGIVANPVRNSGRSVAFEKLSRFLRIEIRLLLISSQLETL